MTPANLPPPQPPIGPPLIGTLLRRPSEALRSRLLHELHAAGFTDLVAAHLAVLRYPGPHGRRPSDIAAETGMTRQAVNYLLGQLEKAGYLTRRADPGHRSTGVYLTIRGHAALHAIQQTVRGIEADLQQELGQAQMTQLRDVLIALNATSTVLQARAPGQPAGPEHAASS
jgi:DNA-binding MarR family transcriptional regulator